MRPEDLFRGFARSEALARGVDVLFAVIGLVLSAPLLFSIYLLILLLDGRPVLFRQKRIGKDGVPFTMFKFRTMREAYSDDGQPLPPGERMTPLGRLLRVTSLDEVPELLNVLRGEMRLVGPRPMLAEDLPVSRGLRHARHSVKPGITGWAQINGRNLLDWDEKVRLDLWYMQNRTIFLDLRILLITMVKVITCEGIERPRARALPPPFVATSRAAQRTGGF